jgi:hypothetical protein
MTRYDPKKKKKLVDVSRGCGFFYGYTTLCPTQKKQVLE